MTNPAVEVHAVSKKFRLYTERHQSLKAAVLKGRRSRYDEFLALDDVSFDVPTGSTFGLIGSNGSGKSTLLKTIARILIPNAGTITTRGTVASLLELGSGFHPELSGRENVYLNASIMRIPKSQIDAKFKTIVDFAGVREFIDQPVKNYSSGMYVRLGFAVATHLDPDILLVDEVIAVGDAEFQDRCLQKFADFRRQGRTVIVASHALGLVETLCDEVGRLDHGRLVDLYRPTAVSGVDLAATRSPAELEIGDASAGLTVAALEILDRHGFEVTSVGTGDSLTLRVRYHAETPVDGVVFALELRTRDGLRAWAQHSRDAALIPASLIGSGSVDLVIRRLTLQSGRYEVRVALLDDALTKVYDFRSLGFCLEVTNNSLNERQGLAVLGGSWGNSVHDPTDVPVHDVGFGAVEGRSHDG